MLPTHSIPLRTTGFKDILLTFTNVSVSKGGAVTTEGVVEEHSGVGSLAFALLLPVFSQTNVAWKAQKHEKKIEQVFKLLQTQDRNVGKCG